MAMYTNRNHDRRSGHTTSSHDMHIPDEAYPTIAEKLLETEFQDIVAMLQHSIVQQPKGSTRIYQRDNDKIRRALR